MASLPLSVENFKLLKEAVAVDLGGIPRSGHLDEALAASLGYRTYAALRADIPPGTQKPARLLSDGAFEERLPLLCPEFQDDADWWLGFEVIACPALIKTVPISAYEIEYKSRRMKAWRNLMVATINAGLKQGRFGLLPGQDAGVVDRSDALKFDMSAGYFEFMLQDMLVLAYVEEAGFDELSIYAMLEPTDKAKTFIRWEHNKASSGAVWAKCWFERRTGAWVQSSTEFFRCRSTYLDLLADLDVEPDGFGDRGRVVL